MGTAASGTSITPEGQNQLTSAPPIATSQAGRLSFLVDGFAAVRSAMAGPGRRPHRLTLVDPLLLTPPS
jgi:hypothetical protein